MGVYCAKHRLCFREVFASCIKFHPSKNDGKLLDVPMNGKGEEKKNVEVFKQSQV